MKKQLLLILLFFVFTAHAQENIALSSAKFKTGDNRQWKEISFNDESWKSIKTNIMWEEQGYNYDGYAWYRFHFKLPLSLKKNSYWKDSLRLFLAKIDDVDETFLNGEKINQTGSFPTDNGGYSTKYDEPREYHVAANNKLLRWDKENILAVRVYDGGGGGGIFGATPFINMMDLIDGVVLEMNKDENDKDQYTINVFNKLQIKLSGSLSVSFKEKNTGKTKIITQITPYILTPQPSLNPRINGAKIIGVRPGSPFLYKIAATGEKPLKYFVQNLPQGLYVDENTGVISGALSTAGEYKMQFVVSNNKGSDTGNFIIKAGDLIALIPAMGWNSWNCWGLSVSDEKVRSSAKALIDKGLIDHGWTYMNIDDGSESPQRLPDGTIVPNEKFPNMKALGDWLHALGLKFGIYSSPGPRTCGGYLASYQHEMQD